MEYGCFREIHTWEKSHVFLQGSKGESFEESRHVTELVSIYHSQYLNEVRNTSFSECTMQQTIMPSIKIKTEPYLLKTITSCQLCFPLLPSNERWHHLTLCTHIKVSNVSCRKFTDQSQLPWNQWSETEEPFWTGLAEHNTTKKQFFFSTTCTGVPKAEG